MLVLIVEDEARIRAGIAAMLQDEGFEVIEAGTVSEATGWIDKENPPSILCDVYLPDGDGFDVLRYTREHAPETSVILMTAFGNRDLAIEALRQGAYDYITKPIRYDELYARLLRLQETVDLRRRIRRKSERQLAESRLAVLGESGPMQRVRRLAEKAAASSAPLLISGETGVGKGLLAKLIHASSPRHRQPFLHVNCASIPENLLESELFGYRKGAFTGADSNRAGLFEEVGKGTLMLDEIGDMPMFLQAKLLHVLDDGAFRPLGSNRSQAFKGRIIAATNVDLQQHVAAGRFRQDLFYRLSVLAIEIPPLRNRKEDLPSLAARIYRKLCEDLGRQDTEMPPLLAAHVQMQSWPGNVRQLRNFLERHLIFGDAGEMEQDEFHPTLAEATARFEAGFIQQVIEACNGDKAEAARRLGIGLSTLYRKQEQNAED